MSKSNESVLVVEDDAALREALLDTLRSAGLSVLSAADAQAALQLLQSEDIAAAGANDSRKNQMTVSVDTDIRRGFIKYHGGYNESD